MVVIPRPCRTGPTCRMAGWRSGANMNTIPTWSRTSPMRRSQLDAHPQGLQDVGASAVGGEGPIPVLGHTHPRPAATRAAAVEILKVVSAPPPVPQVSTSSWGSSAGTGIMTSWRALHAAGHLRPVGRPLVRRPIRRAPSGSGEASPEMEQRRRRPGPRRPTEPAPRPPPSTGREVGALDSSFPAGAPPSADL